MGSCMLSLECFRNQAGWAAGATSARKDLWDTGMCCQAACFCSAWLCLHLDLAERLLLVEPRRWIPMLFKKMTMARRARLRLSSRDVVKRTINKRGKVCVSGTYIHDCPASAHTEVHLHVTWSCAPTKVWWQAAQADTRIPTKVLPQDCSIANAVDGPFAANLHCTCTANEHDCCL